MKAFRIFVNGEQVCTAGIGPNGVLVTCVNWVGHNTEGHLDFRVGGLDSRTDEHADWSVPPIRVGDEVSILVVETDEVDPEAKRHKAQRDKRKDGMDTSGQEG
jgi:hypothetical protein